MNMSGCHSSIDMSAMSAMPQHLMPGMPRGSGEATTLLALAKGRGRSSTSAPLATTQISISATCCLILAFTLPMGNALSLSTVSSNSLVNQARMIRELKHNGQGVIGGAFDGESSVRHDSPLLYGDNLLTTKPLMDSDALSASLFDDFANSLDSAISKTNYEGPSFSSSEKSRAEEFDRFMAEDSALASIILENTKPGSLVDQVKQSKGADILNLEEDDMEARLQREAAYRRRILDQQQKPAHSVDDVEEKITSMSSSRPSIKIMRRSRLAAAVPVKQRKNFKKSSSTSSDNMPPHSPLLSREQEYALAHTIQAGTRVHKLKAEYESTHSEPLTKKMWAQLANMSPNELRKLISEYRTAKQELVSSNMGLVRAVVKSQYARKAFFRGVPMEELIQEGSLGLIRAAELFDPAKGLRFSTYATIWIKGVLSNTNSLDEVINLPNREKAVWNKIKQAMEDLANESTGDGKTSSLGNKKEEKRSSEELLASKLGMDVSLVQQHLRRMNSVSKVLSLDYQYASTTRSGFADSKQEALQSGLQFGTDADLAERAQFKADILSGLVRNLTQREVTLMRLRYGLEDGVEYTVKECAAKMGINRETIRQLQHSCLRKLREASNMESLQEYLLTVA